MDILKKLDFYGGTVIMIISFYTATQKESDQSESVSKDNILEGLSSSLILFWSSFQSQITAREGRTTERNSGSTTVTINVLSRNTNPPAFTQVQYLTSLVDNRLVGSLVTDQVQVRLMNVPLYIQVHFAHAWDKCWTRSSSLLRGLATVPSLSLDTRRWMFRLPHNINNAPSLLQ